LGIVKLLDSARERVRAMDPFRVDVLIAAVFVIACMVELALLDPEGASRAVTFPAGVVAMSALAFRRRNAILAGAMFGVAVATAAIAGGYLTANSTTPFVAALFLLFSISRHSPKRQFAIGVGVLVTLTTATIFFEDGFEPEETLWACMLFGLPVLAGRALRSRSLLQAELREKADAAERDRAERARGAVEDERGRIAAELQAMVANGLSAMVVQAEAVPRRIDAGDFAGAGTALAAVEETGRDALTEMRRLLGVLRRDGEGAELAPQPGLPRVLALVERTRERGLPVELRIEGWEERRGRLSPGIDLTAYRVVEDTLEAAAEQGATAAELVIRYSPDELRFQIRDDRDGGESDRLPGLRDRVGLYGGHLSAGRQDDGSFRLRVRLPVEVGV
jgi:signal transduction histidine kinase